MMFGGQTFVNDFNIFKWRRHRESSLTKSLLKDVPPEIELSEYGKIPSPGSESPSGLLNGESFNAEPISDLDLFFQRVYSYYCEKGLWCIIIKWIVELLSLGFTISFSGFFLLFVDWDGLRSAKCGMDAMESGMKPCDLAKEAIREQPLTPLTVTRATIVGYLGLLSIYWIFCFLRFFAQLKVILGIRHFFYNSLHVTDNEIQTIPWETILEKVVRLQSSQQVCVVKDLSVHEVVMCLMRKENYLIGMINKGVLAFPISSWLPGVGAIVKLSQDGTSQHLVLPKTLEWSLHWCIFQSMFNRNYHVRRDFISNPKALRKRFMIVGITMVLLSPFLVIFMLVYLFLRHAEQLYNHPSTASSRRWSNLSKWMFREFNEVEHLFKHRINSSVVHASEYLKQFPSPIILIVAKFISFVSGGFAAILIIIAFLEESLLEGHIFGRNLLWYAAVFGTITAISRAAVTNELLVINPEGAMSMVVRFTHYMPKRWRGKESTDIVRIQFETLFKYTGVMLLEEMSSIFLTPFLLLFVVPKRVEDILQFIADFTVNVDGVGHVCRLTRRHFCLLFRFCSFSTFDFQNHGNSNYGSPYNTPRSLRSCQGKMEKSFLSFQCSYPTWESSFQGKQFLTNLRTFREQNLQGPLMKNAYIPRVLRGGTNLQGLGNRNNVFSVDVPYSTRGFHLSSLWLIDEDQRSHPYLLDWYYTARTLSSNICTKDNPTDAFEMARQPLEDPPIPSDFTCHDDMYGKESLGQQYEDRLVSQLGASTSTSAFRDAVFQHHDSGNLGRPTRSHWWARTGSHGVLPQTSFIEPPNFNQFNSANRHDNFSDSILEEQEQEQQLDWRSFCRLSKTNYVDDHDLEDGGSINLHFIDIYSRPPESPTLYRYSDLLTVNSSF